MIPRVFLTLSSTVSEEYDGCCDVLDWESSGTQSLARRNGFKELDQVQGRGASEWTLRGVATASECPLTREGRTRDTLRRLDTGYASVRSEGFTEMGRLKLTFGQTSAGPARDIGYLCRGHRGLPPCMCARLPSQMAAWLRADGHGRHIPHTCQKKACSDRGLLWWHHAVCTLAQEDRR